MNGYAKLWWFNSEGDTINTFLLVTNYLSGLGVFEFTRRFMRFDSSAQGWGAAILWIRYVFLACIGLSLVLPYSLMVKGVVIWGTLLPFVFCALGTSAYRLNKPGALYFTLAWLSVAIGTVFTALMSIDLLP